MYRAFALPKSCELLHTACSHACPKSICGEDGDNCMVKMDDVHLPCGHIKHDVWVHIACHLTLLIVKIACSVFVEKWFQEATTESRLTALRWSTPPASLVRVHVLLFAV